MAFRLGSMTTGEILDRGIKVLFARLGTFYLVSLVLMSPMLAYSALVPFMGTTFATLGGVIAIVFSIVLANVNSGAVVYLIAQEHVGQPVGAGPAIGYAFRRLGDLFVASLLVVIIIWVGLILLIIPGIIFYLWFAFAIQVVMLERRGGTSAMSRSKELTAGFRGRIFGIGLIYVVMLVATSFLVNLGFSSVFPPYELVNSTFGTYGKINASNYIILQLISFLIQTLVSTYFAICITLTYFDVRVRKEAFDLELAARQDMGTNV